MDEKEYKYDAFISYRHTELDKYVAETLHKKMESFKLPRNVAKTSLKREKINRVFRDRDELPLASNLEDPIIDALRDSEYLIVICSPRLKESIWCKKEIQTFIEMNGRRKILAVLIEGEPDESFPEELLYDEQEIIDENGNKSVIRKPIEPLAADFRGKNKSEVDRAMKDEILRLLAPMFGLSYDDLKQRHREQKIRKIITISAVAGIAGLAIGAYSTATALKISRQAALLAEQKDQLEVQTIQLTEQKDQLSTQAEQLAINQSQSLVDDALQLFENDDRKGAISTAYTALTEYEGIKMPPTPEAETALAKCMSLYEGSSVPRAMFQIELPGVVDSFKLSPNGNYIIANDNIGNLNIIDLAEREIITSIEDSSVIYKYGFINDDYFYYLSAEGILNKVNISSGKVDSYDAGDFSFISKVESSADGSMLLLTMLSKSVVLDSNNLSAQLTFENSDNEKYTKIFTDNSDELICQEILKDNTEYYLNACDINTYEDVFSIPILDDNVEDVICVGDRVYVLELSTKNLLSGNTRMTAIDKRSGEIIYSKDYSGLFGKDINLSTDNRQILITGYSSACLVDANSGDVIDEYSLEDRIMKVNAFDGGRFGVYTANGLYHSIDVENSSVDLAINGIICSDLKQLELAAGAFVGIKEDDNRIIAYSYLKNGDSYVYEDDPKEAELDGENGNDAMESANALGIEKASFVQGYIEIPNTNMVVVTFFNNIMQVYDKDKRELICEYNDIQSGSIKYYGKLNEYYLININYTGYLLDDSGKIHAQISDFAGISEDNKCVVVYGKDDDRNNAKIAIPVYTREELLDKTQRFLSR